MSCPHEPVCCETLCSQACFPQKPKKKSDKYFRQIGAEVIGNQLIICMEKNKIKKKKKEEWSPPCDCVEIQRPSDTEGPKIINGGDNSQMLLKMLSKSRTKDISDKPQTAAYKIGFCDDEGNSIDECRTLTIYPRTVDEKTQEVYTDHIIEDDREIYLLKIRKKPDSSEEKERKVELEVVTPRPPTPPPIPPEFKDIPRRIKYVVCKKPKRRTSSRSCRCCKLY